MIKVLRIEGLKSLKALNAFNALMLGLKMLPAYMGESYEEFLTRVQEMEPASQEKMIREAALFVNLEKDEIEALIGFSADANGVPFNSANLKNLGPKEIVDIIVAVCCEMAKIKIDLVSEEEKKKIKHFSIDLRRVFSKHPTMSLADALNLSFYEASQYV